MRFDAFGSSFQSEENQFIFTHCKDGATGQIRIGATREGPGRREEYDI